MLPVTRSNLFLLFFFSSDFSNEMKQENARVEKDRNVYSNDPCKLYTKASGKIALNAIIHLKKGKKK